MKHLFAILLCAVAVSAQVQTVPKNAHYAVIVHYDCSMAVAASEYTSTNAVYSVPCYPMGRDEIYYEETLKDALDAMNGISGTIVGLLKIEPLAFEATTTVEKIPQPDQEVTKKHYRLKSK